MYDLSKLQRGAENPHLVLRKLNQLYHRRLGTRRFNAGGVDVFNEDWDTLVILDACRYDVFEERADLPGELRKVRSRGAATPEFVRANFTGRDLRDTVYVTRNSWFLKLREELDTTVHAVYHLIDPSPAPITEKSLEANRKHPDKRLIVHYLPPHHPFVGPTADEHFPSYDEQSNDLFERIQRGELDVPDVVLRRAYEENVDRVLPEVERLLENVDGKTVVTSDHGELLGDVCRPIAVKEYGHHPGLYVPELVEVPWHVHQSGPRPDVTAEDPVSPVETPDRGVVDERLRDLGYRV